MWTIINGIITAAGWVSYVKPPIYFGSFGALGGFAFWVALIWFGTCGKAAAPSIESDLFNPTIPGVRRTRDGGFGVGRTMMVGPLPRTPRRSD